MSWYLLWVVFLPLISLALPPVNQTSPDKKPLWILKGLGQQDKDYGLVVDALSLSRTRIEKFFGKPFAKPFTVEIFPSRAAFDDYFTRRWKVPKTEPWMVASGVGDKLTLLSREVWKTQAREHDPHNDQHLRELIAHELVHVYHGQYNPTGDFEGMDDLGWLVEGLAVCVSGQLEGPHRTAAADAVRAGKQPGKLAQAWSGRYRYGVCGSMVRMINQKMGRDTLRKLLSVTKQEEALKLLKTSEQEFLQNWVRFVKDQEEKR